MNKALYPRLAATNLRKNGSTYFPYILTCVCSVLTFYTMHAMASNKGLMEMPGASNLTLILWLGVWVIGLFSTVLIFYTNGFLIKRRKKELGLYSILGMEKKHIARVLLYETLFTSALSLVIGLAVGMLIGKLLFMLLLNILQFSTPLSYSVPPSSLTVTVCLFAAVFFLTLLTNLRQIHLANPIALLQGNRQGEKQPRVSWPLALLGLVTLGGGYAISLTVKSPLDALLLFFVAVILVIIGTYCLFTAGSIAVLRLLRRNKRFYYKPNNFIPISGMIYRMKQNAVGLANICILSTMVLVTVSTTVSLYIGQEDILGQRFPLDLTVSGDESLGNTGDIPALVRRTAQEHGVTLEREAPYHSRELYLYRQDDRFVSGEEVDAADADVNAICFADVMPLEDYNRMTGSSRTLEEGEILLFSSDPAGYGQPEFSLLGTTYRVKEELDAIPMCKKAPGAVQDQYVLVFPDMESAQAVADAFYAEDPAPLTWRMGMDLEGEDADCIAFAEDLRDRLSALPGTALSSMHLERQSWYASFGGFLFIGIFLGLMFMMATVLIIYYKQISEGYDDHDRFEILQKVGMSRREVRAAIRKQILLVFFLPLLVAAVHIGMAMPVIIKLLGVFALYNVPLILICSAVTLLFFAGLYALVYSLTARTYYRLVQA